MKTIWSFDLGKASIGEAVRDTQTNEFPHKASLLIQAEFASTKDAATRRRMWRTRQAHKAREAWLDEVWRAAKIAEMPEPLRTREVGKKDEHGFWIPKSEWKKGKGEWKPKHSADYRLEREFAPAQTKLFKGKRVPVVYPDGKAKDGAPAATPEDFTTCYISALLRIKLLRGEKLEPWQIYKALHSASQKRGYGRVPWAARDAKRSGKTEDEIEKDLEKGDAAYKASIDAWKEFCGELKKCGLPKDGEGYRFPCYYDAWKMGLWSPENPNDLKARHTFDARSTRKVRFDRADVEREIAALARQAAAQLDPLREAFTRWKRDGWTLHGEGEKRTKTFAVAAADFGDFFVHGPAGELLGNDENDFSEYLRFRSQGTKKDPHRGIHPGSADDWMGATAQKVPRFDNRIIENCAVIPRLYVCRAAAKPGKDTAAPDPDSLLHCEVAFLMKLKNVRVLPNVRALTPHQIKLLIEEKRRELADLALDAQSPKNTKKLAKVSSFSAAQWKKIGQQAAFSFKPHPQHLAINVVQAEATSLDAWLSSLEQRLNAVRVLRAESVEPLTAEQIATLLKKKCEELGRLFLDPRDPQYGAKVAEVFSYNRTGWAEVGERDEFGFQSYANHEEVEAPKCGGRSRFSRPALRLLRALVLSGEAPSAFRAKLLPPATAPFGMVFGLDEKHEPLTIFANCADAALSEQERKEFDEENARNGLLVSDLDFLRKMRKADATDDTWDDLFIPNEKLDGVVEELQGEDDNAVLFAKRKKAILDVIGSQNDPIVRNRLEFFWNRLRTLQALPGPDGRPIGEPQRIVLEFAREDFLGEKAKKQWKDFNEKKREQNKYAREHAAGSEKEQLKIKLWQDQGGECVYGKPPTKDGHCPYTQHALPSPGTEAFEKELEIDHIVPRDMGGPDAYINYVLTFGAVANQQKKDRIPYVWFSQDRKGELDGYIRFVQGKQGALGKKKVALLTRPDAADLVSKYTALAQTAWVSRLAQTIIRLHFGWPLDHQKGEERVLTLTGGQTAQFRRDFRLNSLLGPDAKTNASIAEIPKEEDDRIGYEIQLNLMDDMKKNRVDPRHHALDAMVLGLIPEWRHFQAKKFEHWSARHSSRELRKEILERPTPFFDAYFRRGDGKPHLDNNAVRQFLARMLGEVDAEMVAFERAHLEQTLYSKSMQQVDEVASKPLDAMAFTDHDNPALRRFDADKLRRWLKRCVDAKQKEALENFLASSLSVEAWEQFKKTNRGLFSGGKAKVRDPKTMPQYTVRKELRLLAYEGNTAKKDTIFNTDWVRDDAANIDIAFTGMAPLKADILAYLAEHPETTGEAFKGWLEQRCQTASIKTIRLQSIADKGEEAESKRRGEWKKASLFGCRQVPLAFAPKRLTKAFNDICDPWLRDKLRTEFKISGEGKKATHRDFNREEWEAFCQSLRKPKKDGFPGPRVLKIAMLAGNADEEGEDETSADATETDPAAAVPVAQDEFKESTKTPGAFFKGKSHQGYYLYVDEKGQWQRMPVYAHQSRKQSGDEFLKIIERLSSIAGTRFHEVGFLQTGCKVQLPNEAVLCDRKGKETGRVAAGFYRLNTLNKTGQMKLTSQNGKTIKAQVNIFITAGLRRAD